jgi:hypothetical protein
MSPEEVGDPMLPPPGSTASAAAASTAHHRTASDRTKNETPPSHNSHHNRWHKSLVINSGSRIVGKDLAVSMIEQTDCLTEARKRLWKWGDSASFVDADHELEAYNALLIKCTQGGIGGQGDHLATSATLEQMEKRGIQPDLELLSTRVFTYYSGVN